MAEYILRDQAIIAVTGAKLPDVSASGLPIANGKRSVTDCVRRLKDIPAADVRSVVRGKWIVRDNPRTGWYRVNCSECGEDVTSVIPVIGFFPNAKPSWNFCPNCGADMKEES